MKTEITELLGITYPVIQGGMAWVAEASLAAAVSNAGGLGTESQRQQRLPSGSENRSEKQES